MGKIGVMAVMAAILAVWIKGIKPEYSLWIMAAAGVLMGGLASNLIIVNGWKPYFLYTRGFAKGYGRNNRSLLYHLQIKQIYIGASQNTQGISG